MTMFPLIEHFVPTKTQGGNTVSDSRRSRVPTVPTVPTKYALTRDELLLGEKVETWWELGTVGTRSGNRENEPKNADSRCA